MQRNGTGALTRVSISYLATYSKYGPPPQHLKPTIGMQHDAASLLWYHILSGPSARESIAAAGAVSACILIVSNPDSSPLDRTCALGKASRLTAAYLNHIPWQVLHTQQPICS